MKGKAFACCACFTKRRTSGAVGLLTLCITIAHIVRVSIQFASQPDEPSAGANFTAALIGDILWFIVTCLLYWGVFAERPGMLWPYLVYASLYVGLLLFQCLIIVYVSDLKEVKAEVITYCVMIIIFSLFVYLVQGYDNELRSKEMGQKDPITRKDSQEDGTSQNLEPTEA